MLQASHVLQLLHPFIEPAPDLFSIDSIGVSIAIREGNAIGPTLDGFPEWLLTSQWHLLRFDLINEHLLRGGTEHYRNPTEVLYAIYLVLGRLVLA